MARNLPYNWEEQKREREKKKESGKDQHSWEGAMKEERNPHLGRAPNWWGDQLGWRRNLKASEKSTGAKLRRAKQRVRHTDNQYHCLGHHRLRHTGRGWALRLKLQRSVLGRGLGWAVWRYPEEPWSNVPWAGDESHSWGTVGGGLGSQEKQGTMLGRVRERGERYFPLCSGYRCQVQTAQPSQTPEVGMSATTKGSMNRHHWWPKSPQGSLPRRAPQPSATHCPHFQRNAHTLLLLLTKALRTTYTSLRVIATPQGPATRSSLPHLPVYPQMSRAQQPDTDYRQCPLSPSPYSHMQATYWHAPIKGITAYTHWGKRQQASKPKAALTQKNIYIVSHHKLHRGTLPEK